MERLVYNLEERLRALGRLLLQPDPQAQREEAARRLDDELRRRRDELRQACAERAAAQRRLAENHDLIARLPEMIQHCLRAGRSEEAWRHALALDRCRQGVAADQDALPRLGQLCWSLHFEVRRLERRLGREQAVW
jgi:hypothetical protein